MPSCFYSVMRHLASTPSGCMVRVDLSSATNTRHYFPIYVLNAPFLSKRRTFMEGQLAKLGAADVTFIMCANRDEVNELSPTMRACAYPCVQLNRYFELESTGMPRRLSNGTVSLALKHKLAAWDLLERKLRCALVLEDDAMLPADLFRHLEHVAQLPLPVDSTQRPRASGF